MTIKALKLKCRKAEHTVSGEKPNSTDHDLYKQSITNSSQELLQVVLVVVFEVAGPNRQSEGTHAGGIAVRDRRHYAGITQLKYQNWIQLISRL